MSCPVCRSENKETVVSLPPYTIVRCGSCRTAYVDPMPQPEILAAAYSSNYSPERVDFGYRRLPDFRRKLAVLGRMAPRRGILVDVGCAEGEFLEMAQAAGWTIAGVEPGSWRPAAEKRLGISIATTLETLAIDHAADVVTLWEVIEHLTEPITMLSDIHERLRPGGLLALSTPNGGHWRAYKLPATFQPFIPPFHLVYFTAASLTQALQQAGFEDIEVHERAPAPPFPAWLDRATSGLQQAIRAGHATRRQVWVWRLARVIGWAWAAIARRHDDVYTQLEAYCRSGMAGR